MYIIITWEHHTRSKKDAMIVPNRIIRPQPSNREPRIYAILLVNKMPHNGIQVKKEWNISATYRMT